MKHIRLFENAEQAAAILPTLEYNTLSAIRGESGIALKPGVKEEPYIEINGVKWAKMNLGAQNMYDPGLYFQWADIQGYTADQVGSGEGRKSFDWPDYKYCNGTKTSITKYTDGETLYNKDDAALTILGEHWHIPSQSEISKLRDGSRHSMVTNYEDSGVDGLLCVDTTNENNKIFIPCGGILNANARKYTNSVYIWGNKAQLNSTFQAVGVYTSPSYQNWGNGFDRCWGMNIRPVWRD